MVVYLYKNIPVTEWRLDNFLLLTSQIKTIILRLKVNKLRKYRSEKTWFRYFNE